MISSVRFLRSVHPNSYTGRHVHLLYPNRCGQPPIAVTDEKVVIAWKMVEEDDCITYEAIQALLGFGQQQWMKSCPGFLIWGGSLTDDDEVWSWGSLMITHQLHKWPGWNDKNSCSRSSTPGGPSHTWNHGCSIMTTRLVTQSPSHRISCMSLASGCSHTHSIVQTSPRVTSFSSQGSENCFVDDVLSLRKRNCLNCVSDLGYPHVWVGKMLWEMVCKDEQVH